MFTQLTSFDGTESFSCNIERPTKYNELFFLLQNSVFIPRGAGLSYCFASGGIDTTSIDASLFNRILNFNKEKGIITVEAGINLGDLLSIIIKEDWFLPVLPGYPGITVGGCIGFNVHGKSQYNVGLFCDFVNKIKLFHPASGDIVCSDVENKEIFELTKGGFGLTGFITEIELRLIPLKNKFVNQKKVFVESISEAIDFMTKHKDEYEIMYSWNNLNNKGKSFGSGVLYVENFLDYSYDKTGAQVQFRNLADYNRPIIRFGVFNRLTSVLECKLYEFKEKLNKNEQILPVGKASFPIYGKEIYYKFFSKKGLMEYQMIIPTYRWEEFEKQFYNLIQSSNIKFTLGSLKLFEGDPALLNFRKSGICLAFDMTANKTSKEFFKKVDLLVIQNEGIANISKDGRLAPTEIEKMYPGYNKFKNGLKTFEKNKPLNSALRSRLNL